MNTNHAETGQSVKQSYWGGIKEAKERFWKRVHVGSPDQCWPWARGISNKGYGKIRKGMKWTSAHRVAFEYSNGTIPDGLWVLGTRIHNMQDCLSKGRYEFQKRQKLQPAHRLHDKIMDCVARGMNQSEIARDIGVNQSSISRILYGRKGHITGYRIIHQ